MDLDYKLSQRNGVPLITLTGRFDAEAAAFVKSQLPHLVTEQQPNLVVDLTNVTFVDSLGLAALVSGLKLCRKYHGVFRLYGLQNQVKTLFEITRLDQAFEVFSNAEAAFADFGRG